MENKERGYRDRRESNRSEYGSEDRNRSRRPRISHEHSSEQGERRPYGERRSFSANSGERRPYGERRSFNKSGESTDRRPSGDRRSNFGERRSFNNGDRRPYGNSENSEQKRNSFGDRKPFNGERRSFNSDRKPFNGERKPFNSERRQFNGERRQFDGERRQFNGERRSFGTDRKPFEKKSSYGKPFGNRQNFNRYEEDAASAGINKMISERNLISEELYSDNDNVRIPVKDVIRLNKYIANSGICSRREADNYILAGVVTVNGEVVTELGTKVNVNEDDIRFNGERLKGETKVYIVMNKPKGYVTTAGDPHADKTVMDLLTGCESRVFAVGRLDKNTTGVLMFTNDGEMAEKLTHPSYDKKKIYQVSLDRDLKKEDFDKIMSGITLTDGEIAADDLQYIDDEDHRKVGIEIHSGKNRIVRRIFESLGYDVKALDRVYFAGLTKKGIKRGGWRYLNEGEVNILKIGAYK